MLIAYDDLRLATLDFLISDFNLAMTFAIMAHDAKNDLETKRRNQAHARRAYDSVSRLRKNLTCTSEEDSRLDAKIDLLKMALLSLGEVF